MLPDFYYFQCLTNSGQPARLLCQENVNIVNHTMRRGNWQKCRIETHNEDISLPGSHKGTALAHFQNTSQSPRTCKKIPCVHGWVARLPVAAWSPVRPIHPVVQGLIVAPLEEGGKGQARTVMWVLATPGLTDLIWAVAPVRCFPWGRHSAALRLSLSSSYVSWPQGCACPLPCRGRQTQDLPACDKSQTRWEKMAQFDCGWNLIALVIISYRFFNRFYF